MEYDILIQNALIIDGTGKPGYPGNVAIRGDRIVKVGAVEGTAHTMIDASGLVCCPGFVEPHTHADRTMLAHPLVENYIMQGVTTLMGGNCGNSAAPTQDCSFSQWLDRVEASQIAVNYVPLIGHNVIRTTVMGNDFKRPARPNEIDAMKEHVHAAMMAGAFGFSSGLDFHGQYADSAELVELIKVAQKAGGLYSPHSRNTDYNWPVTDPGDYAYGHSHGANEDALVGRYHGLVESVELASRANRIPLHIAHLTQAYVISQPHPEFLQEALARATLAEIIDKPRAAGLDVSFNVIACSFSLGSEQRIINCFRRRPLDLKLPQTIPDWLGNLSTAEFLSNLTNENFRTQMRELIFSGLFKFEMTLPRTDPYWMDCFQVMQCRQGEYVGKTIGELARSRSPGDTAQAVHREATEVVFDLLLADPDTTWAFIEDKRMSASTLRVFLQHPRGMPALDVGAMDARSPEIGDKPPPAAFALFPHYIHTVVHQWGILTLEQAIHKATALPAQTVMGLTDRGILQAGACADVLLLNPETIQMRGTFSAPTVPPDGIESVFVNGQLAYTGKHHTGVMAGRLVRRQR